MGPLAAKKNAAHPSKARSLFDNWNKAPPAPRTTWFTFYSHRAQREYYYNPVSGVSSWQIPADGVISRLPGSPVQSSPSPQESKIPALDEEQQGNDAKMSAHRLIPIITKPRVALAMFLANLVLLTVCCYNFGLTSVMLHDNNTTNLKSTISNIPHRVAKHECSVSDTMTDNDAWDEASKETKPADARDAEGGIFPFLDQNDSDGNLNSDNSEAELTPIEDESFRVDLRGRGEDSAQPEIRVDDKDDADDSSIQHINAADLVNEESLPQKNTGEGTALAKDADSFDHLQEQDEPISTPETLEQSSSDFLSIKSESVKSAVTTNEPGSKDNADGTGAFFQDNVTAQKSHEQYDEGSATLNEDAIQSNEESKASFDSESDKSAEHEADPVQEESAPRGSEMVPEIALLVEATEILMDKTSDLLQRIIRDANSAGYSVDLKPKLWDSLPTNE